MNRIKKKLGGKLNIKVIHFIRNFSYTLTSNLVSLLISTLVVLIVPKLIGQTDYGYWQLYIFYSSYAGFLHFGWNDGIYLRYGGKEYHDLEKGVFFSQFYMLLTTQIILALGISVFSILFFSDENRVFIIVMTVICMLLINMRFMLLYILQATNRIKEYSQITILEKVFYFVLITAFLTGGIREYRLLIASDLTGKLLSLALAMYCCKDIVFNKIKELHIDIKEAFENIHAGIKLMIANIASMLIIGIIRFGIERNWDVATFGKVSLTLSISNLMMLFINAVGIVMFPVLRRTDEKKLPDIYVAMRDFLMVVLLAVMILYFPLRVVLDMWLPKYADSLTYMALVFPMCIYEGKMALLINTYLKTLRKEKLMLKINVASMLLSVLVSVVTILVMKNLTLAIVSIVILLAIRCAMAEAFLAKIMDIRVSKDVLLEMSMTAIFIILGWFADFRIALGGYIVAYAIYLVIKKSDLKKTMEQMKRLMRRADTAKLIDV